MSGREFYYATMPWGPKYRDFWSSLYPRLGEAARFWVDLRNYFSRSNLMSARVGTWKTPLPFEVMPGFEMPAYQANFSKSFSDITDARACEIAQLIRREDARIFVYYSGGIDSTISLVALLRTLSAEELQNITICLSAESIEENPVFFERYIRGRFNLMDSAKKTIDFTTAGNSYAIDASQGDPIFGAEAAIELYRLAPGLIGAISGESRRLLEVTLSSGRAPEASYEEFADLLCAYFQLQGVPGFGSQLYETLVFNIKSAPLPIYSLHDFFWWMLFNVKYFQCAFRSALTYSKKANLEELIQKKIINWFHSRDYQLWSMANNNNGEKIRGGDPAGYKWAGRSYIYNFDRNEWYFRNKTKTGSFEVILDRSAMSFERRSIFGIDKNYNVVRFTDPDVERFVAESFLSFKG